MQSTKTALITGASRGLGKTLAEFLGRQGFELVLNARGRESLEAATDDLEGITKVTPVCGDVSDPATRQALARAAAGGLDVLVNNASSLGQTPLPELKDADLDGLEQTYRTNVTAPLGLIQAVLPALEKRRGLIVNISSDAAICGYEDWGVYGSSKAALDLITKTLAAELKSTGVSAVAVDPGDMRTDMHQAAFPGEDISECPLPSVTLPFWAWLLGQDPIQISGERFRAQADTWTLPRNTLPENEAAA